MRRNAIETVLGAVVLCVAGMFLFFAYTSAEVRAVTGYDITASFYKVGGLSKGSDARINGIKVGTVSGLTLDHETFEAVVTISLESSVALPTDSVAAIGSQGIVGGKYLRIEPGQAKDTIKAGGRIKKTRDFRSLEDQVGEIIFLATGGK